MWLCKSNLLVQDDVVVSTLAPTPYRWAVINPRPSVSGAVLSYYQGHYKECGYQTTAGSSIYQPPIFSPSKVQEAPPALTCFDILESICQESELSGGQLQMVQQTQEEVKTEEE